LRSRLAAAQQTLTARIRADMNSLSANRIPQEFENGRALRVPAVEESRRAGQDWHAVEAA